MILKKLNFKNYCLIVCGVFIISSFSSCGKQTTASPAGLNIQYEVLNLSPDLYPINIYIDYLLVNKSPFIYGVNQGYFYVPSIDVPYQIRSATGTLSPLFNRTDILKSGAKYSLFVTGAVGNNSLTQIFTVDTSAAPKIGSGKIRFLNASPTEISGLDLYANGALVFNGVTYPNFKDYVEVPVGNYIFNINETGSVTTLKQLPSFTVQDGKLYTIYTYGYTTTTDSATFAASIITNK